MKVKFYTEERISKNEVKTLIFQIYGFEIEKPMIDIIIVSSFDRTSFVDGIGEIYSKNNECIKRFVVEITQTTDKDSRNTSAYQRLNKFIVAKKYLPNYEQILYFREPFICTTNTCLIGLSMAKLINVKVINCEFEPLDLKELLKLKNNISQHNSSNIPLTVNINDDYVEISGKLKNGNNWADSTVGFMSTMIYLLSHYNYNKFCIVNHLMTSKKLVHTKNKFRKIVSLMGVSVLFEGTDVMWTQENYKFNPSETYYKILEKGEKLSLINFSNFLEKNGHEILFTNISGCERGKLSCDGNKHTFPKSMRIPDIISIKNNKLFVIEGECTENLHHGLLQIKDFGPCVKYVCNLFDYEFKNIYIGVITDLENNSIHEDYFGNYLNETNFKLKNEIFC